MYVIYRSSDSSINYVGEELPPGYEALIEIGHVVAEIEDSFDIDEHYTKLETGLNANWSTDKIVYNETTNYTKRNRVLEVSQIKVTTTSNKTFDGDETSQDRMGRAINALTISGETTTRWKLADNTKQEVTIDELKEALVLAGTEQSRIWMSYD